MPSIILKHNDLTSCMLSQMIVNHLCKGDKLATTTENLEKFSFINEEVIALQNRSFETPCIPY